ncbi:hypothetical protein NDU88_003490 [Pleurodeles waltl]|uniref:Uncharacterized protein n=1 Tax=Pleurodeles waltl TaxID=8319 RepID=A0AAV7V067_PLEWA|nr:hypothetical protein NDU88_003490 [Pleurodeles waltl]
MFFPRTSDGMGWGQSGRPIYLVYSPRDTVMFIIIVVKTPQIPRGTARSSTGSSKPQSEIKIDTLHLTCGTSAMKTHEAPRLKAHVISRFEGHG